MRSERATMPDQTFWAGRRVLVTGHTGFKGSWLVLWLTRLGAEVTGFALPPATLPSAFGALDIAGIVASRFGDIRDERALDEALRAAAPEVVFHLAAQPLVRRAFVEPAATFDVNVMGTVRLLEAIRRSASVTALVVVTSDKCYAENRRQPWRPHHEADPLGGTEPYAASKACAEIVTAAYRASFLVDCGIRVATARSGNVIGGGDWSPDRLVTDAIDAMRAGRSLQLRYPGATRPWQHVLDSLAGYLILAEKLVANPSGFDEAWNFGPDPSSVTSVEDFVARFERSWGSCVEVAQAALAAPREAMHLSIDASRAKRELGWQCRLSLDAAIDWTVEWHKAFERTGAGAPIAREQLARYETIAASARAQISAYEV